MRFAAAALAVVGGASMALGQAVFSTGPGTFTSVHTFSFTKDGTGETVQGFEIFVDYIGDGGGTWASDTNCMITTPDGQTVSIGGFGTPADLDYSFQGSISGAPGTYSSGPHYGWIDGGPADGVYTVKLTQDFGVGFFSDFQVIMTREPFDGDTCGLKKSPDQGAFWQPLSPTLTTVYANSFVACEDAEIDTLGMWLLAQTGAGTGPDVAFEVWGSIGGNPAFGPDASNVLSSTGFLSLGGTATLDFYSAPASGSLTAGETYWFVGTTVGQSGGEWQVGGHTQNSEGIQDNGTFWFSNDPAGINFDGQGLTPEMAFCVEASGDGGCYPDCNNDGVLNILDFVCYQGLFQSGDDAADCNDDGVLNILDFVCFQGEFQAGC